MKEILFMLIVWALAVFFTRPLGALLDKDNGDYKKHNKTYKMEVVK